MSATRLRRSATLALIAALVLVGSACEVRTDVDVRVQRDGSGTVTVAVNLDRQAAAQIPALASQLRLQDLRRAGWRLEGPTRTAGGGERMSATKRFGQPADAGAVLEELAGKNGPFRGFTISRTHSFARTTWEVRGSVDLRKGLAAFSDQRLTALLGGLPFGRSEKELVRLAHGSLADAAPFRVTVHLPGAPGRTFVAHLGERPVPIDSISRETSTTAYLFAGGAAVALIAALGAWVAGGRARRRPRRAERGMGTYQRQRYEPITETEEGPPPGTGGRPELVRVRRPPAQSRRRSAGPRGPLGAADRGPPKRPRGEPPPTPPRPPDR